MRSNGHFSVLHTPSAVIVYRRVSRRLPSLSRVSKQCTFLCRPWNKALCTCQVAQELVGHLGDKDSSLSRRATAARCKPKTENPCSLLYMRRLTFPRAHPRMFQLTSGRSGNAHAKAMKVRVGITHKMKRRKVAKLDDARLNLRGLMPTC